MNTIALKFTSWLVFSPASWLPWNTSNADQGVLENIVVERTQRLGHEKRHEPPLGEQSEL